jgi:hypothetical protein
MDKATAPSRRRTQHLSDAGPPRCGFVTTMSATPTSQASDGRAAYERLAHIAAAVLNAHTNHDGRCARCADAAFPCEHALLAEHNVALL